MKKSPFTAIVSGSFFQLLAILTAMHEFNLWPSSWESFFTNWTPWITIVANLSALIALMYCWIVLQSLKKEAIEHRTTIEKLSKDFTSSLAALDGLRQATGTISQPGLVNAKTTEKGL